MGFSLNVPAFCLVQYRTFYLPGGAILILEKILPEEKTSSPVAHALDINMLHRLMGQERTLAEYKRLLDAHGFKIQKTIVTPGDMYACVWDAIFATKM